MLPVATCVPWKLKKVATSSWAKIDQAGQAGLPSEKKVTFINVNHAKADLPWFTCMALKKRRHFTRFWPKTKQICCSEFSFHLKVPGHPKICRTLNHVREITMKSSIVWWWWQPILSHNVRLYKRQPNMLQQTTARHNLRTQFASNCYRWNGETWRNTYKHRNRGGGVSL